MTERANNRAGICLRTDIEALHLDPSLRRRIAMTASCSDADHIPKVPGAGEVFEENGFRVQRMHNGVRVLEDCYYGKWMTELIRLLKGHHEPQEEKVFYEILKNIRPRGTMLEFGSFWGYYSLWFQQSIAEASTFLIEPDPSNLEIGCRNFALNHREGEFFNFSVCGGSSGPQPFTCESDGVVRQIPSISVDDFLLQNDITFVDLLLADIQGAELEMLEGAAKTIAAGRIRFVILSTHHHSISHDPLMHQRCLEFLESRGANILAAHNVSESYCGDGLIAAALTDADQGLSPIAITKNYSSNSLFGELEYDLAKAEETIRSLQSQLIEYESKAEQALNRSQALHAKIEDLQLAIAQKDQTIAQILESASWKLTDPLRTLARVFRKYTSHL